jgi:hypothetical protein
VFQNVGIQNSDTGELPHKKAYNIQNTAKVWNQENVNVYSCIGNWFICFYVNGLNLSLPRRSGKSVFICFTISNWKYNLRTLISCIYCRHTNKPKFSRITCNSTPHINGSWNIVIKMSNVDWKITFQTSKVKVHNSTYFCIHKT